jgi:predicted hydrocarbon binding protein
VYEQLGPTSGRISIRDAACYSPTYCSSEAGYLEQVIATHGGSNVSVSESACQCTGAGHCMFEMRWS